MDGPPQPFGGSAAGRSTPRGGRNAGASPGRWGRRTGDRPGHQVHLLHRRGVLVVRQGTHRLVAGPPAQVPGTAGHHVQARPVHQRRPRHHEPVRARRGVRHRGRRRDRSRSRPLRAVHRREPPQELERHHRTDLLVGDRQGAPRRLPGQDRPGHSPRDRRDQEAGQRARLRRRRRGHRGDRRHRGRHRDCPLHRGHPPVPAGRRSGQRVLRPPHPGALPRALGRAEDQAHPALGHRAPQPGDPTRRHRMPVRPDDLRGPQAQDLAAVRRTHRGGGVGRRRRLHLPDPPRPPRGGARPLHPRDPPHSTRRPTPSTCPTGSGWSTRSTRRHARCASASSASTSTFPTPTCRWSSPSAMPGSTTGPRWRSSGSRPPPSPTSSSTTGCGGSTAWSSRAGSASAGWRARSPPPATPARTSCHCSGCASACR